MDIAEEMMSLTLAIVGKTLFDTDVVTGFKRRRSGDERSDGSLQYVDGAVLQSLAKTPLPQRRRFDQAKAKLDAIIYRMIEERRASGKDRGDLLSMLLLAQDEETGGGA